MNRPARLEGFYFPHTSVAVGSLNEGKVYNPYQQWGFRRKMPKTEITDKQAKELYGIFASATAENATDGYKLEQLVAAKKVAYALYTEAFHVMGIVSPAIQTLAAPQIKKLEDEEAKAREALAAITAERAMLTGTTGVTKGRAPAKSGGSTTPGAGTNAEKILAYKAAHPDASLKDISTAIYGADATTKTGYIAQVLAKATPAAPAEGGK